MYVCMCIYLYLDCDDNSVTCPPPLWTSLGPMMSGWMHLATHDCLWHAAGADIVWAMIQHWRTPSSVMYFGQKCHRGERTGKRRRGRDREVRKMRNGDIKIQQHTGWVICSAWWYKAEKYSVYGCLLLCTLCPFLLTPETSLFTSHNPACFICFSMNSDRAVIWHLVN